jgi:hypothetical protein
MLVVVNWCHNLSASARTIPRYMLDLYDFGSLFLGARKFLGLLFPAADDADEAEIDGTGGGGRVESSKIPIAENEAADALTEAEAEVESLLRLCNNPDLDAIEDMESECSSSLPPPSSCRCRGTLAGELR